jgi:hypothetical protein
MIIAVGIYAVAWIVSLLVLSRQDMANPYSKTTNLYQCPCNADYRVHGNIGILLLIVAFLPFTFLIGVYIARKMATHKKGCLIKLVADV